ncbi:hypothetical protein [Rhodococcus sp. IEGM 1408]|uniref:hypothetical protein n=1 Tax=Rhodococcus sp. IEGM 1408 TaxID=3082220 RepID=UPI00295583A3|nr:hypothetical protein [Rhodococcus sp. IEGM 1408]MDV8000380.1 hypothetical protein [Rhodococcus sp. IEGM 1408]
MNDSQYRLNNALSRIAGYEIPGACPDCTATQTVADLGGGVYGIEIAHDDSCPAFQARGGGGDQ